jgi:3-hydroxybutyryl-CoA dehydrogenase
MKAPSLENVTVLGAGVLGGQIAWQSAFKGKNVTVYDLHEEGLAHCRSAHLRYADIYMQDLDATEGMIEETRGRLDFTTDMSAAVAEADLVIEAVPEIPDVKTSVYRELSGHLPDHTLLVTNTSTLLPSDFAEATGRPEKYCTLHFANLIWELNVGEIMTHPGTAESTVKAVTRFAIEIGMVPIPVQKEQNGYVLNTLLVPMANAAQTLVTNGVSTPEYIDRTYMIMNRGCSMGPCGMIDVVGMTTMYNVLSHWGEEGNDEQMLKNARYLKECFIEHGKLGVHTGEGYYTYPHPSYQAEDFLDVPDLAEVDKIAGIALNS